MKLLMFDTKRFWYKTFSKTVDQVPTVDKEEAVDDTLVIFINVEADDEATGEKKVKKAVEHIEWLAKKTGRRRIVLHSFAHLSDSKSGVAYAEQAIGAMRDRLNARGFEAKMTPFGYLLEFDIHVKGESLAKVWKSF